MRLLDARTAELHEFFDPTIPLYAILSHRWGEDEVTYQDIATPHSYRVNAKAGWRKIVHTCQQALADGLDYVWIDTCCINKADSVELSEAINSMFQWYKDSVVCYTHLDTVRLDRDVPGGNPKYHKTIECALGSVTKGKRVRYVAEDRKLTEQNMRDIINSPWFFRGWTLQELIAPEILVFFDSTWRRIGQRDSPLAEILAKSTRIDLDVLSWQRGSIPGSRYFRRQRTPLTRVCAARKMSWAAKRQTKKLEDKAYCLLGIFGISMPLLYGEGERAFRRIQEEIVRRTGDLSIFAWEDLDGNSFRLSGVGNLWAPSVRHFEASSDIFHCSGWSSPSECDITPAGFRAETLLLRSHHDGTCHGLVLACRRGATLVVLTLVPSNDLSSATHSFMVSRGKRLKMIGLNELVHASKVDFIIQEEEDTLRGDIDNFHSPKGIWLRVSQQDQEAGLWLRPTGPPHSRDICPPEPEPEPRLMPFKYVDTWTHLHMDDEIGPRTVNLQHQGCVWQIWISHILRPIQRSNLNERTLQVQPVLTITHGSLHRCSLSTQEGNHGKIEWSTSMVYAEPEGLRNVASGEVEYHLTKGLLQGFLHMNSDYRLRVALGHEELLTQHPGAVVIELMLEPIEHTALADS